MKKIISLLVVLPAVCLALGYGAGMFLDTSHDAEEVSSIDGDHASETHEPSEDAHGEPSADGHEEKEPDKGPIVVRLGQMIVPVYKPHSVTYVVINLGITVDDSSQAEHYNMGENGVRIRDAIYASLKRTADGHTMRGPAIDTEKLSNTIAEKIIPQFAGVNGVLFLDFYKKDVARS